MAEPTQNPSQRVSHWSTSDEDPQHAIDYWREIRRLAYVDVVCDPTTPQFRGEVTSGDYGSFTISTKQATGDLARRSPRQVAEGADDEYLFATFQVAGTGILQQADRTATVSPGTFALYDSSLPFVMSHEGPYQQVVVRLAADNAYALAGLKRDTDLLAVTLDCDGAMSAIAAFFLNFAATQRHDPRGAEHLAPHASALAATLLSYAAAPEDTGLPDFLRHDEIQSFIRTHLADPDLDADTIATAVRTSRRSLYRLFEGTNTSVMELARSLRIDTARKLLLRYPNRPISAIARETGFSSVSSFHRTFRTEAGLTPGDYREQNLPDPGRVPSWDWLSGPSRPEAADPVSVR